MVIVCGGINFIHGKFVLLFKVTILILFTDKLTLKMKTLADQNI